jgi:MFS family permease
MRRLFVLVAAVILVDTMFYAAIVPLLPEYRDELGLSKSAAGILSASYAAGTLLAALPAGWLAARVGVRQVMLGGLGLMSASSLVFAFADNVVLLDAARFAQGVGGAMSWTGGLAWLLAAGPRERRGELVGSVIAVAVAGLLLGPVIGGAATVAGPEIVFSAVGLLGVGLIVWVLATPGVRPSAVPRLSDVAAAMLKPPVLVAWWLVALPSILAGAVDVLAPLRLDDLGASGVAVGAVFLVAAAIEAAVSPSVGRLSDRRGRMTPIRIGLALTAGLALLPPLPTSIVLLGVVVVVVFLAMSLIWTPAMALLSDEGERAGLDLAFATALVNLAWAGGQVIGGSAVVGFADLTSDDAAYVLLAALFVISLAALAATGRLRPTAEVAEPQAAAPR